jgi:1,4-alpha-glucan branching enzyme
VWLNGANDWVYRHLHKMAERMARAANEHPHPNALRVRLLNQMARELLLAQSSDWAFILKAQTHTAYAYRRIHDHLARFNYLDDAVRQGRVDELWFSDVETKDNLFPFLDYRIYATPS